MSAKSAFGSSDFHWVSRSNVVTDFADDTWLILSRNYFAKLVWPLVSNWMAGGLELYVQRKVDRHRSKIFFIIDPEGF